MARTLREELAQSTVGMPHGGLTDKLSYDADSDTVDIAAANFTVHGSPVEGGGPTAPTDILLLGTDVPLINGWLTPDPDADGEPIGRIYKQGGRVHFFGSIKAPGGDNNPFAVPDGYLPYDFGDEVLGVDLGFAIVSNWRTVRFFEVANGGSVQIFPTVAAGVLVQLDGVSWPLAS